MSNKDNLENCPICNAKIRDTSNSLHIWEIEYQCGCKIYGAIGSKTRFDYFKKCNKTKD